MARFLVGFKKEKTALYRVASGKGQGKDLAKDKKTGNSQIGTRLEKRGIVSLEKE